MGSVLNLCLRIRRKMPGFVDLVFNLFRWVFQGVNPLWRWATSFPGLRFLSRLSLPWRTGCGNARDEEARTENDFTGDEYKADQADEFYCEYDSTWETEPEESSQPKRSKYSGGIRNYNFSRFQNAARDMQKYRNATNKLKSATNSKEPQKLDTMPNLSFYLGQTPSLPDGVYIKDFHNSWKGQYDQLERVHTFIQWLFPLQEPGMNYEAKTLTEKEIEAFRCSEKAKKNLLESYKLMLDFYGIELKEGTPDVIRASNWMERFKNLNRHTHNNLRITRILKCMGTLGYPHYQAPLVRFFLEETLVNKELPNVKDSALSYFVFAVLDKRERRKLLQFAYKNYEPKSDFVWCPKKIQNVWSAHLEEPK